LRFSSNKREKFVILTPKKSEKRSVNVENLFSDFEWYFASVWIDLSSSRHCHVSSIRLWFSSLVTTGHSNIVSFYSNLLLSKRSLFYSFSSSECLMILTSIIEKIGTRLSTCDHKVVLLEFYAVLLVFIRRFKNRNVKQFERKTIFTFFAFRNLPSTLDDRFSWLRTRL